MWKLIIKNLWSRRHKNGWLLAELIIVSIVMWVIIDPVVVLYYDKSLPLGYDADRLCMLELSSIPEKAAGYDPRSAEPAARLENYFRLIEKVKTRKEIALATPITNFNYLNSEAVSHQEMRGRDTLSRKVFRLSFPVGYHFFETYGIKSSKGNMPVEELSKANYEKNEVIVTRDLVEYFFKEKHGTGERLYQIWQEDTTYTRIAGVLENVRMYSSWRPSPIMFSPQAKISPDNISDGVHILVRLKDGESMNRFLHEFRPWMIKNMKAGNLFIRTATPYSQIITDLEYRKGVTNKIRLNTVLVIFFLFNLCLGVIGTFWLQTKTRKEEAGILLSYGGHPSFIIRMLLGEGFILCTVAYIIGCFIYWWYAKTEGLYTGLSWIGANEGYWISSFGSHFAVISVIIYLIILFIVSIGIYIPARGFSRIHPVEALRNE